MPDTIRAAILSLGTEITSGIIKDTHGSFLGAELSAMGIQVDRTCQMRDDSNIIQMVQELVKEHDVLLITGGLGPTSDDLTREAIAHAAGIDLVFDESLWEALKQRFGLSKAEANRKQAMVPFGFQVLQNPNGTAPGIWGKVKGHIICAMPGPPREMEPMFRESVRPLIADELELELPLETEASSFLIPEAMLEDVFLKKSFGKLQWRTRFQAYKISFYLMGGSRSQQEEFLTSLRAEFGEQLIRPGNVTAAGLAFKALQEKGLSFATAESCTGGMIGSMFTDIPGASECYWGGFITYDNQAKIKTLGLDAETIESKGAVSEEVVEQMALGTLHASTADVSVAVSGIAGPSGGTEQKPVGTVCIAVARRDGLIRSWRFHFGSRRDIVRRRAAVAALLLVELAVREADRLDMVADWHYS